MKSEKNVKNVKNVGLPPTYSFTGLSITQPLILNYRNRNSVPVPVSHQHHTPCSEMRTQETNMQLTCRSVIVKRLYALLSIMITFENFEAKISIDMQQT